MATADLLVYGLILIPLVGTILAGYGKFKVGPFFGLIVATGAVSVLLSYLLLDLFAALIQLGALALGAVIFLALIGIFGEKFSYRSPMLLLAAVALFPLGLVLGTGYTAPLFAFGIILGLNMIFALLLSRLRRNSLTGRKGKPKAQDRYLLTSPTVVAVLVAGLMVLNSFTQGTLL